MSAFFLLLLLCLAPLTAQAQTYYYTGRNPATPAVNDAASAIACDVDSIGAIRYNTGNSSFEGCGGVAWSILGVTFPLLATPTGTTAAPAYSFTGDATTGMFRSAASTLEFASNGVETLALGTTASGKNYFKMTPGATGVAPILSMASSTDTNGAGLGVELLGATATATGAGGPITLLSGTGLNSGAGGALSLTGGTGGATGNGGAINLTGGAAGATSGTGGAVSIAGGTSTLVGGALTLASGAGISGGNVSITGASAPSGIGGALSLTGGTGGTQGGAITITGGGGTSGALAGGLSLMGGTGNVAANSGQVTIGTFGTTYLTVQYPGATAHSAVLFGGTGTVTLPTGTTAQEPTVPTVGMIRYNTDTGALEAYQGISPAWSSLGTTGTPPPAGLDKQVQFNDASAMAGNSNFTWAKLTQTLGVTGTVSVSSKISLGATAGASAPNALAFANLSDANISSPLNGQVLTYNSGTGKWANAAAGTGSLDLITGSASQATANETTPNHEYTYNGVETAALTYPMVIQNTSNANNSSGALLVNAAGTGNAQVPLVINQTVGSSGDYLDMYAAGTVTNGVLSGGTKVFGVSNQGVVTAGFAGGTYTVGGTNAYLLLEGTGTGSVIAQSASTSGVPLQAKGVASQSSDLFQMQVGAATQTSFNSSGIVDTYGAIATVGQGVAPEYAAVDLTGQSAAIAATTLYTPPAAGGGMYRVCFSAKVTTAATTSSTLGGAVGFQLTYTDPDDSTAVTTPIVPYNTLAATLTLNNSQALENGCLIINVKGSGAIKYKFGYTSSGATAMQYSLHIKVEAM